MDIINLDNKRREKMLKERQLEERITMAKLNRQIDLMKVSRMRDQQILSEAIEEIEEEETYTVTIDEDGKPEVEKKN